jgi:tRNA dimethylallyltransferase
MSLRVNFLIGCTASGKAKVGQILARRLGGEIVSVDSMKIYRRMDIGTAKPDATILREIPHHMVDVVEPSEAFSLGRYVAGAEAAVSEIAARGRPVLAVGGTMLYVQGLTAGVFEGPGADLEFRGELRARALREGSPALHAELTEVDPQAAARIHPNDLRRIERALEVYHTTGTPISELQTQWAARESRYDCRLVALRWPKDQQNRRINARVKRMLDAGLVEEVRGLLAEPAGIGPQAGQAVGYTEIIAHLRGELTLAEAVEQVKIHSRRLGKHQRTWMRRMPQVQWVDADEADTAEAVADRVQSAWEGRGG